MAKERLFDVSKTVSKIAYALGFKYPQHFARLFKKTLVPHQWSLKLIMM